VTRWLAFLEKFGNGFHYKFGLNVNSIHLALFRREDEIPRLYFRFVFKVQPEQDISILFKTSHKQYITC